VQGYFETLSDNADWLLAALPGDRHAQGEGSAHSKFYLFDPRRGAGPWRAFLREPLEARSEGSAGDWVLPTNLRAAIALPDIGGD